MFTYPTAGQVQEGSNKESPAGNVEQVSFYGIELDQVKTQLIWRNSLIKTEVFEEKRKCQKQGNIDFFLTVTLNFQIGEVQNYRGGKLGRFLREASHFHLSRECNWQGFGIKKG